LKEGKVDIIIGTHRLVSKDVKFKDLGLMIIDEEQKFGVSTKEKLKQMRANVDTLTLDSNAYTAYPALFVDGRARSFYHINTAAKPAAGSYRAACV
jgi:primosomal protein N'